MTKKTKILIAAVALFVIVSVVLVLFVFLGQDEEPKQTNNPSLLVPNENLQQHLWSRKIIAEIKGGVKVITNLFDGYQILVPVNWEHSEVATGSGGLKIVFNPEDTHAGPHIDSGLLLTIKAFSNPKGLSARGWLAGSEQAELLFSGDSFEEMEHPEGTIYTHSGKLEDYDGSVLEDSSKAEFVISSQNQIYVLSCSAIGEHHENFVNLCTSQVQTFKILE